MGKSLILLSNQAEDLKFAEKVAALSELDIEHPQDLKAAVKCIGANDQPVIFVDASTPESYESFEKEIEGAFGLYSSKISVNRLHYLSSVELHQLPSLVKSPIFGSFIQRAPNAIESGAELYGRLVKASLKPKAFGVESFLKSGAKIQTLNLSHSQQKLEAVEVVRKHLLALQFRPRAASLIANAVDELTMNAIFDAPVDPLGRRLYETTPRNTPIELKDQAQVSVQVGFDGEYFAFTAIDQFGSVEKDALLKAISASYEDREYRVKAAPAGAGLGLSRIFQQGGSFFFVSDKSVKTEATVFFKKTESFTELKNQWRFLSTQFYY